MLSQNAQIQNAAITRDNEPVEISVLINSVFYFLSCVFIMQIGEKYRLVVLHHNNKLLYEGFYKTVRGARIAFSRLYKKKAWNEDVKATWTIFYPPDKPWLKIIPYGKIALKDSNGKQNAFFIGN